MSEKRKYELHIYSAIENNYSLFDAKAAPSPREVASSTTCSQTGVAGGAGSRVEPKQGMEAG
jgi:hypothetical protein